MTKVTILVTKMSVFTTDHHQFGDILLSKLHVSLPAIYLVHFTVLRFRSPDL